MGMIKITVGAIPFVDTRVTGGKEIKASRNYYFSVEWFYLLTH